MRVQQVLGEAALGLRRNLVMSVAAVLTVAVSLGFAGGALLVLQTVDRLQVAFFTDVQVQVYLDAGVTEAQRTDVQGVLQRLPLVEQVTYESKQQAYERFVRQNPNDPDLVENVSPDQLPESYSVKLRDPEQFEVVASAARDLPGVDDVDDNREVLNDLFAILNGLTLFAGAVAAVQVLAAVLLIYNTVRLTAFSRRREIGVMRLVGATQLYIQLPFLVEGLVVGVVGTAVAGGLLAAAKAFLLDGQLATLFSASSILQKPSWSDIFLGQGPWLLAIGVLVSAVTSFITVQRYVRV